MKLWLKLFIKSTGYKVTTIQVNVEKRNRKGATGKSRHKYKLWAHETVNWYFKLLSLIVFNCLNNVVQLMSVSGIQTLCSLYEEPVLMR